MTEPTPVLSANDPATLVELVNRVVDRGVVLRGEVTISVAEVDLLYLGIDLLLCSVDRLDPGGREAESLRLAAEGRPAEGEGR